MWNEIIFLLGIKVIERDYENHLDELSIVNGWTVDRYGDRLTVEEVRLAYNLACNRKLGIEELFSLLAPKHVGIVLDAYLRYTTSDLEINRVFKQQLLVDNGGEQTPEEITAFMESMLVLATGEVKQGRVYPDPGNGLFDWLYEQGRITLTDADQDKYVKLAAGSVPRAIGTDKVRSSKPNAFGAIVGLVEQGRGQDYASRLQAQAKRLFLNDYLKTL